MALFPCVVGNHKYQGPQQSAYLAALNGSFAARSKLRLCPVHIGELGSWLEEIGAYAGVVHTHEHQH